LTSTAGVEVVLFLLGGGWFGREGGWVGHWRGAAKIVVGDVDEKAGETREVVAAEDFGEVIGDVELGGTPQATYTSRIPIITLGVANAEEAEVEVLGLGRDLGMVGGAERRFNINEKRNWLDRRSRVKVKQEGHTLSKVIEPHTLVRGGGGRDELGFKRRTRGNDFVQEGRVVSRDGPPIDLMKWRSSLRWKTMCPTKSRRSMARWSNWRPRRY